MKPQANGRDEFRSHHSSPEKDFGPIADDYAFFEAHATEPERDAQAYVESLADFAIGDGAINMLDFGCGSGNFTVRFLKQTRWPPERLRLTLVEPAESVRKLAVERLAEFTEAPIAESSALPAGLEGRFDLVLANHVFYYVTDLPSQLSKLIGALAPAGVFLTAIAGLENALIEFWTVGFKLIGRQVPYHTSEDVEAALRQLGANYQKERVPYELMFPDTEANRMHIIRFLLADYLADMPLAPLLTIFDKYSRAGRIEIRTASDHFTV